MNVRLILPHVTTICEIPYKENMTSPLNASSYVQVFAGESNTWDLVHEFN